MRTLKNFIENQAILKEASFTQSRFFLNQKILERDIRNPKMRLSF